MKERKIKKGNFALPWMVQPFCKTVMFCSLCLQLSVFSAAEGSDPGPVPGGTLPRKPRHPGIGGVRTSGTGRVVIVEFGVDLNTGRKRLPTTSSASLTCTR